MPEAFVHSYLKPDRLPGFPVRDRPEGRFFEGPLGGKILQEVPLARMASSDLSPHEQVEEVVKDFIIYQKGVLKSLTDRGIRTVNPQFMIGQREVVGEDGVRRTEKVLGIVEDKIGDALTFEDIIESGDPEYLKAYDELALRLVPLVMDSYDQRQAIETEVMRLDQFVLDPSAENTADMTVLVDVKPEGTAYETSDDGIDYSISTALSDLAYYLVRMAQSGDRTEPESLAVLTQAIGRMPKVLSFVRTDIKWPLLEAIGRFDADRIESLSYDGDRSKDDEE